MTVWRREISLCRFGSRRGWRMSPMREAISSGRGFRSGSCSFWDSSGSHREGSRFSLHCFPFWPIPGRFFFLRRPLRFFATPLLTSCVCRYWSPSHYALERRKRRNEAKNLWLFWRAKRLSFSVFPMPGFRSGSRRKNFDFAADDRQLPVGSLSHGTFCIRILSFYFLVTSHF